MCTGAPDALLGDLAGNSFTGSVILAVLIGVLGVIDLPLPEDMQDDVDVSESDDADENVDNGEDITRFVDSLLDGL